MSASWRGSTGEGSRRLRVAAREIRRESPTALKVALAAVRRTRRFDFLEAGDQEFRVTTRCFAAPT